MSQWCVCSHYKLDKLDIGLHYQEYEQQITGSYFTPLAGTGKAAPGIMCPDCSPSVHEVCWQTGQDQFVNKNGWGPKACTLQGGNTGAGLAQCSEEEWTMEWFKTCLKLAIECKNYLKKLQSQILPGSRKSKTRSKRHYNGILGSSGWTLGEVFSLEGQCSTTRCCPERLWDCHPCTFSKLA